MKETEISVLDVLEIALKKEADEKRFYTDLAKHVADDQVREFLNLMAHESHHHENEIRKLLGGNGIRTDIRIKRNEVRKLVDHHFQTDIFPTGNDISKMAPEFKGVQEVLDFAIEVENVAAEFYKLLGQYCEKPLAKAALLQLEIIELDHAEKLESFKERYYGNIRLGEYPNKLNQTHGI
ncbi:MAG: ferritin family protein [Nitrospinales bacterium]